MSQKALKLLGGAALNLLLLSGVAQAQAQTQPQTPDTPEASDVVAEAPVSEPSLLDQIMAGKPILDVRVRYEGVNQTKSAAITRTAEADTVRMHLGWETADWRGLKGLVEFETVQSIGPDHFAVNVPGAATPPLNGASRSIYPLVNDPRVTELNRLQLNWTANANLAFTIGRQRILIDDQRFVGNVGWRQDEQTFDAARADMSYGRIKATYIYANRINRVLGDLRDWNSDSQLFNAVYSPAEELRLEGFVYALDFKNSAANSSITKGARVFGKAWLGLYQVAYSATYARQSDYRHRTPAYDLDFVAADVAGTFDIYTLKLDYEQLEGNGTRGFTTPLATTHAFQGWADAFVSPGGNKSFVDGIKDTNLTFNAKPRYRKTYFFNPDIVVRYHDFIDYRTDASLGHEWDLQGTVSILPKVSLQLKYADFKRDSAVPVGTAAPPPSRTKVWFVVDYRF
jgi:hypothetical protein